MRRSKLSRLLLSLPLSLLDLVVAQSPLTPINLPSIDLSSFGQVGLAGDFAGISLYQFTGQNPTTQQGTGDGVYIQLPNGALGLLGHAAGTVSSLCALNTGLFVAGNFSSINGMNASNIAVWNFTLAQFEQLDDRDILGSMDALYCDRTDNLVYVGGDFQSGGSNNAIVWNASAGHWQDLPFGGFDGPINTIQPSDAGTILFGGTFDALGNGTVGGLNDRLVVNLVTSQATTQTTGFTDPGVLFCTNGTDGPGSTWLLEDNTPGDMTVLGNFGYRPTKLRLRNTHFQGRGTKTFRFVALPIDGIMNFTYTDPTTGQTLACDATCPLSNDTNIAFQDFEFVNVIGMNGFTLFISDWYGDGGGLSGIELFEDDIVAYADNNFNEPTCQVPTLGSTSFTSGGNFQVTSSFPETSASYLTSVSGGTITLEPHILSSGNYSIRLFTPGCIADNTCNTRGIVNITTFFSANDAPSVTQIYQTNNYDKYDTIFQGRVQAGSTSFRPRIVIAGLLETQTLVAQKVQFMTLSTDDSATTSSSTSSSGGLNGLYEYAPGNWTASTTVENVTLDAGFDVAGTDLGFDAQVVGIVDINGKRFVAGQFSSPQLSLQNVMQVQGSTPSALPFGGLNGPIESMAEFNGTIYFAGQFTGTSNVSSISGLSYVASFDTGTNTWIALGQGLNGNVTSVVLYAMPTGTSTNETVVVFSGEFTQILGAPSVDVAGFAIWIPSAGDWAERLGAGAPFAYGSVAAETASTNGTVFVAGGIDAWQENTAQGFIGLGNSGLNGIPLHFSMAPPPPASSNGTTRRKRSLNSLDSTNSSDNVISAGAFYAANKQNITVIGGHFTLNGISNLAFINGSNNNAVSGLPSPTLPTNSSVYALLVTSNLLSVGGTFSMNINSNAISGLLFYDFSISNYATTQPPALVGQDPVIVNTLAAKPSSSQILVGGKFSSAGSLPCPAVCIYDTSKSQWLRPGTVDVEGEVSQVLFSDENTAIVVGNVSFGGNATNVAKYDFTTGDWTSMNVGVTGPVQAVLSQDSNTLYLAGQNSSGVYFGKWTSSNGFQDLGGALESTSRITALEFLPLSTDHASNPLVSSDRVILLMGDIQLPGFGNASAVLFDGSQYQPYILTTKSDGSNGLITTLFSQQTQSFTSNGNIALGWVIVIALAASLFLILLLVIGGIIAARVRRRREGYVRAPGTPPIGEASLERVPPAQLLSDLETRRAGGYL